MGGTALTRSEYSYTRNNNERGIITIPNVTGDIVIRATGVSSGGGCLVEGTKILLANGKYKNIEDIKNVSGIGDALFEKIKNDRGT